MFRQQCTNLLVKIQSITTLPVGVVMLLLFLSCGGNNKAMSEAIENRDSLPVMATYEFSSLISDSGITRYRLNADEWLIFDKKNPPYWAFEKGVYLEQFDSLLNVDASIKADTAYYFNREKLWKLIGNVDIRNLKNEQFSTELLYWNEATQKIYSDKFIRIVQPDRIITGYGFDSNQQMTSYVIHNMQGVFYVDEAADSTKTDSSK